MAKTLFRRYRLSRTVYGDDDAVNDAKSDLCEAARGRASFARSGPLRTC